MSGAKRSNKTRRNSVNRLAAKHLASAKYQEELDAALQPLVNRMKGRESIYRTWSELARNHRRFMNWVRKTYKNPKGGGKTRKSRRSPLMTAGGQHSLATCVSAYFPVKNKHDTKYLEWFKHTLNIKCPYVFFTNKESVDMIKKYRKDLPTHYIICELPELHTYKYKDKFRTDPVHCPSAELNVIWNEKIYLMQKASEINPFHSEWFIWIDAGINIYRTEPPPDKAFPNESILRTLPKDKFIYSSSNPFNSSQVTRTNHYHHVSGTYIMHKSTIKKMADIYSKYMDKLVDKQNIWTDQVILTHIYKDHPELFYKLCDGYGEVIRHLYRDS